MAHMRRSASILVLAIVVAACWLATAASADDTAPNNVVSVTSTADSPTNAGSHMQVGFFGGDTLDSNNIAQADSHDCTGCHTVAVAVQAVIGTGNPSTVAPVNAAIATNENCTSCATFAFAYQYVVTTDGPVHLTDAGRRQLHDLSLEFRDAAESDMSFPDLDARLHDLAAQFHDDILTQLRHDGGHPHDGHARLEEQQTPGS
jgi:hypothetical protein